MDEDPGVLGKLPRSRPGVRSAKRDAPARTAKAPPRQATSPPTQPRSRPSPPPAPPRTADPIGDVVRTGAKVAEAGVKVAGGLTRGLLRRLPKP